MFPRPVRLCRLSSAPRQCNVNAQFSSPNRYQRFRTSSTTSQPPSKGPSGKLWLTAAVVAIAAGGAGIYTRSQGDTSSTTLDPGYVHELRTYFKDSGVVNLQHL
ncbi:oxidoreductase [Trichophyton rubrum CBS 118892]|uniref:Uncharacterized protein n=1 Tax=Trichophyton rubrum (strain ATCC MYA-4607 / CBS 118892) TaxID=559305 RepID=A0A080WPU3_TRIRC|nr:oxidoreductase [Trichophyton rubrum CBS 118892]KFL62390.1 hypothetical protein TERG_12428 [Trichophyton rubrum CBS 118892]